MKWVVIDLRDHREKETRVPTINQQAVHPPLLDLRTGFPFRSTVPSFVYSSTASSTAILLLADFYSVTPSTFFLPLSELLLHYFFIYIHNFVYKLGQLHVTIFHRWRICPHNIFFICSFLLTFPIGGWVSLYFRVVLVFRWSHNLIRTSLTFYCWLALQYSYFQLIQSLLLSWE